MTVRIKVFVIIKLLILVKLLVKKVSTEYHKICFEINNNRL